METLVAVAVHEAKKTRRDERERASAAGKKVPRGKKLDDEEEDADDKEKKAARKRLDPRKVVDGAVAIPGEEEGDAAAGGLTPLARACGRPIGPRAAAIVRALLDSAPTRARGGGALSWTPLTTPPRAERWTPPRRCAAGRRRRTRARGSSTTLTRRTATGSRRFTSPSSAGTSTSYNYCWDPARGRPPLNDRARAGTTPCTGRRGRGIRACSRRCGTRPARRRRRSERGRRSRGRKLRRRGDARVESPRRFRFERRSESDADSRRGE